MEIRPIFSALMRNKTGLVLIALQVAITLAIVTNSLFIIKERIELMNRPSGIDEAGLFTVSSLAFAPGFDRADAISQDMATLRAMPGVIDATPINNLPLSGGGWGEGMSTKPIDPETAKPEDSKGTTIYMVDDHGVNTLGVNIIEGRNFNPDEITDRNERDNGWPQQVIITQALAKELFPDESAVGKRVFMSNDATGSVVVGVMERLQAPWVNWNGVERATLIPQRVLWSESRYLVRVKPAERDAMMKTVEAKLAEINPGRIVRGLRDYGEIRERAYSRDHAMTVILISVIVGLLVITGLGIVGMASFWVTQRVKQIGTRRALGARKFDILRYFQLENFIITSIGLGAGILLSYGFNVW
ncbi:MAG TPA: ABC transporter permease, partial [Xanthomonadales bacterium]|nr:ABC transporter permease [Xanthomonadales bacterium]